MTTETRLLTADFDYQLPTEFIAQTPIEPRDAARLLVLPRHAGATQDAIFSDLGKYLHPGDILVVNETRVIPARLQARKIPTGGRVELLLLRREDAHNWEALIGGKGMLEGKRFQLEDGPIGQVIKCMDGARRLLRFDLPLDSFLNTIGQTPLPPYIHSLLANPERYQTMFAQHPGSAAAPTAGLHFTPGLIDSLGVLGVQIARTTLHVGLDTFMPVNEDSPLDHQIHTEWCQLSQPAAQAINQAAERGGRVVAVGTTSVRTLESASRAAAAGQRVGEFQGATDLFILPGYEFRAIDGMITNFHLPRSTLIMLVSAYAGRERVLSAYEIAKERGYRFYSFGDAMLIL